LLKTLTSDQDSDVVYFSTKALKLTQ